jgi:hypothetical protein
MMSYGAKFARGRLLWVSLLFGTAAIVCWLATSRSVAISPTKVEAASATEQHFERNEFLEVSPFIQIPGPNPILVSGGPGAWDEYYIEAADAYKDFGTYYLYYHGAGKDKNRWPGGYRLGVATATGPLGPWKKYGDKPIVDLGPADSWDDEHVACAMIMKVGLHNYYMWYSGKGKSEKHKKWSIGLATASSPLGPWKKYEGNPILEDFGYVGGVVFVKGKYYLYTEHPIDSTGRDYGPISLAIADAPEGPWTRRPSNPVLSQGGWGAWDDGGFSEGEVVYWEGVFHLFYGGAKLYDPRRLTRESIGYAYSFDGFNFHKYGRNPVATREAVPNAAAFAEVHTLIEPPFIYLYHTLRYKDPRPSDGPDRLLVEHLGVEVLATQTPFRIDMPTLVLPSLGPKTTSGLEDAPPINLSNVSRVALTAECTYHAAAKAGIRVHLRASYDGLSYDTVDLYSIDHEFRSGQLVRKTVNIDPRAKFIKILVQNLDAMQSVSDLKVTVTLGS